MNQIRTLIAAAIILASSGAAPALAQQYRVISGPGYPHYVWHYDGRDDDRDFPTNGFFPGDFAASPADAWIGAAGLFGSNPARGHYPLQVIVAAPEQASSWCARRYRSYDPASGTFVGNDRLRHRC
jgi:BA14K-like protein